MGESLRRRFSACLLPCHLVNLSTHFTCTYLSSKTLSLCLFLSFSFSI
jgi:hypothetical protein